MESNVMHSNQKEYFLVMLQFSNFEQRAILQIEDCVVLFLDRQPAPSISESWSLLELEQWLN